MNYTADTGTTEVAARREPLEAAAATHLGLLLFAFSRLDVAVQLYVDGLESGRDTAALEAGAGLEGRLQRLLAFADRLEEKSLRAEFVKWIVRAHQLASLGRDLRGGRWLPDPRRGVVLLLAEPGEPRRSAPSHSMEDFGAAHAALKELFSQLQRLCAAERGISLAKAGAFLTRQPIGVLEED